MKKHGNIQMQGDGVRCSWMYEQWGLKRKLNASIVLDVFIICQKLRQVQIIKQNTVLVRRPTHRPSK